MKTGVKRFLHIFSVLLLLICVFPKLAIDIHAENNEIDLVGIIYTFNEKDHYEIDDALNEPIVPKDDEYGSLKLSGDISGIQTDNISSIGVNGGTVALSYNCGLRVSSATRKTRWHICDDSSKEFNGEKLDKKIKSGIIVIQTSADGRVWTTESYKEDVFSDHPKSIENFLYVKESEVLSGRYYRVIVGYKTERVNGDTQVLFIKRDNIEYIKTAEVYQFYFFSTKNTGEYDNYTESMALGDKQRTSKGYAGYTDLDRKDPHFGWDLGQFYVTGYTRCTDMQDTINGGLYNIPVFLKNVDDNVVLWFDLQQDINALNGNSNLVIDADTKGYDEMFEIPETDFGRGALIIEFTDYQGNTSKPQLYTNFLSAKTVDADTIVGLFEEGDYLVQLDYKIKNTPRSVVGIDIIPEYSYYHIFFQFAIRNSNCMIFPFDTETKQELNDGKYTPNGFKLDLAKSRYLTIDVQKYDIVKNNKGYVEDLRFNRAAKPGDSYEEEGIYVFTVHNIYTGQSTTKKIYVGTSPIIQALAKTDYSIQEINALLEQGAKIDSEGTITMPVPSHNTKS